MKKIIVLIGIIFLLTSCYSNTEDKKEIEAQKIFENNIECNKAFLNIRYSQGIVNGVKYSEKENSCIILFDVYDGFLIRNNFNRVILFSCKTKDDTDMKDCKSDAYSEFKKL